MRTRLIWTAAVVAALGTGIAAVVNASADDGTEPPGPVVSSAGFPIERYFAPVESYVAYIAAQQAAKAAEEAAAAERAAAQARSEPASSSSQRTPRSPSGGGNSSAEVERILNTPVERPPSGPTYAPGLLANPDFKPGPVTVVPPTP